MLHTNIMSSPENLSHFENYVKSLKLSFTTIALSEIWLKQENKSCYDIKDITPVIMYDITRMEVFPCL